MGKKPSTEETAKDKKPPPEEMVIIHVTRGAQRTSVSMDAYLAKMLTQKLGNDERVFQSWVQDTINTFDAEWDASAAGKKVGARVRIRAGVSRLIQRAALQELLMSRH